MKNITLLIALGLCTLATSCDSYKRSVAKQKKVESTSLKDECPENIACTMDYRLSTIKLISNKSSKVSSIQRYESYVMEGNEKVILKEGESAQKDNNSAVFIIAEDKDMSKVTKSGKEVHFKGYNQDKEVVHTKVLVGHDCCHIKLLEKSNEIIID